MKNHSKLLALVATLFVFTLTSTLAFAQPPQQGPKDEGKGKGPLFHCLRIVNLSEEQQAEIRGILEAAQPTLQALREEIRAQREDLKAILEGDEIDECALGAAIVSVRETEQELRGEMEKLMESIKLVLSPEQAAKLEGCLEAARDDFPGRGNGSGNGQGGN
jgi:Spy/CpxP family protein refolding chaperone